MAFLDLESIDQSLRTDMYFRIVRACDDEVTSVRATQVNRERSMRVKDTLRATCIQSLVNSWSKFLGNVPQNAMFACWALDAARRFVEWIDITLIANNQFLPFIYSELTRRTEPNRTSFRASAAATLNAIVSKRMDAALKISLLESLRINELFAAIPFGEIVIESNSVLQVESDLGLRSAVGEIALLVRSLAMEAFECMRVSPKDTRLSEITNHALPIALGILLNQETILQDPRNEDAVEFSLELIANYVNLCKKSGIDQSSNQNLEQILNVIFKIAVFPTDYDPAQDDDAANFETARAQLITLFRNIAVTAPQHTFSVLLERIQALQSQSQFQASEVELMFTLVENVYDLAQDDPAVIELVAVVLGHAPTELSAMFPTSSRVAQASSKSGGHQMASAALMYFDLAARSHRILSRKPDVLFGILQSFFGSHGLQSSDRYTRSRCAYLLLRLVRPLRAVLADKFLENFMRALVPLVSAQDSNFLAYEDELYLYEAAGLVLGMEHANSYTRCAFFSLLITPLVKTMEETSVSTAFPLDQGMKCLRAAGSLSKGFTVLSSDVSPSISPRKLDQNESSDQGSMGVNESQTVSGVNVTLTLPVDIVSEWKSCLDAVLSMRRRDPSGMEVRKHLLFFFHRMVETLGEESIPYIESTIPDLLKESCTAPDVTSLLLLVNQAVCKFGEKLFTTMDGLFTGIVTRIFDFLPGSNLRSLVTQSEEDRERVELLKTYMAFLGCLCGNNLSGVIITPLNVPCASRVVQSVIQSATVQWNATQGGLLIIKQCCFVLQSMVSQWSNNPAIHSILSGTGFSAFISEHIPLVCVQAGITAMRICNGNFNRPNVHSVLRENIKLQHISYEYCSTPFLQQLCTVILPSFGCAPLLCEQYGKYLTTCENIDTLVPIFADVLKQILNIK
eukprot:CAMPEP_0182445458 /NCGR_PEP_ID=MMETSP1172-20130603/3570_1 /TAXON_ID=708627 /ORGANISM="Timspurckia oligopyrenoides, Strain CCMP3278" /LENGTH=908 /DNA_ID=CAMNT_0024641231 /DNA_START=425 /DNA_END=3151 /DNA_ORIENTATION=-